MTWNNTSHGVVIGDNLRALQQFRSAGLGFEFIYIDPPYNSGQQFSYCDRHGSSLAAGKDAWLAMMEPRLVLAQSLLTSEGVLFVSIDDREVAEVTLLLKAIFGRENHIGTLKWKKKRKPSFLDKHLGTTIEYVLVFAKASSEFGRLLGEYATETTRPILNAGNPVAERLLPIGFSCNIPDGTYPVGKRTNRTLEIDFLDELKVSGGKLTQPARVAGRFRIAQELLAETGFITSQGGLRRHVLAHELTRKHASDDLTSLPTNEDAETELKSLFGEKVFDYPKPVGLLRHLLSMCTFKAPGPVRCLDFFAGSGTLAEAVVAQTSEDKIPRTFVLVQSAEKNTGPSSNRFATIAEIAQARAQLACEKYPTPYPTHLETI